MHNEDLMVVHVVMDFLKKCLYLLKMRDRLAWVYPQGKDLAHKGRGEFSST